MKWPEQGSQPTSELWIVNLIVTMRPLGAAAALYCSKEARSSEPLWQ